MSVDMKETGEKRMHVEIIKVRTKGEGPNEPPLDCDNNLPTEPTDSGIQEQKTLNHNGEVLSNSQIQNSHANKELKLSNGINGKEKEPLHNGNHTLTNSKSVKPKEYKFFKNKGRWICKDTKEIKNEGRELINEAKAPQPVSGKILNSHSSPVPVIAAPASEQSDELNVKQFSVPCTTPIPSPLPEQPAPVHASKSNNTATNHMVTTPAVSIENKIYSIFNQSWDNYKQGLVQNLQIMYQQETQSLNDRIRNLIGLLTELQNENISLRSELESYRKQQHPPH
eukprot:TRINITY_DN930_c0_g4_i1.p1 TRINITY_DN930_c0_g4~~TRINITY_DN930_c0_g4_i1.p1  ORF type:complete len:282 (-),score=46.67 TRINITY_DN930_c0_g4_i1:132-977(-)